MGWLLGCFKCTGRTEEEKQKKRLQSGVGNLVSGRSKSATVAHATSPEDLHIVRKSPSGLVAVNSNGHVERDPLSSPLLDQAKRQKNAKCGLRQDEDTVWSQGYDMVGELESFEERLMQDANTPKQCSDEVKFLRGCHSLLESPSSAFNVTFDKADRESIEQGDYAQHSWLVSSLVTRIQPGGLLLETCSRPDSPLLDICEGGSVHSREKSASQSNSFDNYGDSNALKCAELSLFRVESGVCDAFVDGICESLQTRQTKLQCETNPFTSEHIVPSPPWTFCGTKANEKCCYTFEPSDDLLLERLDVSSLIEDSALITNWELSSGSSFPETSGVQVPSQEARKSLQNSLPSEQAKQKHSDSRSDALSSRINLSCSPVLLEACTEKESGFFVHAFVDEVSCFSNDVQHEAKTLHGDNEVIHDEEDSSNKDADPLLCVDGWVPTEESDSESTSQSCFSSQFRLSKRVWSSSRKDVSEKESNIGEYSQHKFSDDSYEGHLSGLQPEIKLLQESRDLEDDSYPLLSSISDSNMSIDINKASHGRSLDLNKDGNDSHLSTGSLETKVPQDSVQGSHVEDETDSMKNDNPGMIMFPFEEEDCEQRKKMKIEDRILSGKMHESMLAEDDKVPLLNAEAFADEARVETSENQDSIPGKHEADDSSFKQPPLLSFSSSPHVESPSSVTSYRSPAKLADDRPILGTVAAHWSPIATRKWWDGKGIPNSTNKYQEDQKVSWHAIPFEVRLEQALAKQESVSSK